MAENLNQFFSSEYDQLWQNFQSRAPQYELCFRLKDLAAQKYYQQLIWGFQSINNSLKVGNVRRAVILLILQKILIKKLEASRMKLVQKMTDCMIPKEK